MKKTAIRFFVAVMLCLQISVSNAQSTIEWQKCLGGNKSDIPYSIQQTSDGGYIVSGYSSSNDGDVTLHYGSENYRDEWIVKLDNNGAIQWQKTYGGSNMEYANSIVQTTDGGYVVVGQSNSVDGDLTANHGGFDYWIYKLDDSGNMIWQHSYGGSGDDIPNSVQQTTDGGFIVAGISGSTNGDVTGNHGTDDYWVIKLDASGVLQWQKCYGGSWYDWAMSVGLTTDGGYIINGFGGSNDSNITGSHGLTDMWIVKTDSVGTIQWQKSHGGSSYDYGYSCKQTNDGGYIAAGYSTSINGDVTVNHGNSDYWIVKTDSAGDIQWQKSLGGSKEEETKVVRQTVDGGYIVAGYSRSVNGDVAGLHDTSGYYYDCWIVKLLPTGDIDWQKCLGGHLQDLAYDIDITADGGCVIAGTTNSIDGDVSGGHGDMDFWIVKLSSSSVGTGETDLATALTIFPNPVSSNLHLTLQETAVINILNIQGQEIMSITAPAGGQDVNISSFSSGIYFINVKTNKGILIKKIIKE